MTQRLERIIDGLLMMLPNPQRTLLKPVLDELVEALIEAVKEGKP